MPCNVCGAAVTELRRGRCWGCYTRWVEIAPGGAGRLLRRLPREAAQPAEAGRAEGPQPPVLPRLRRAGPAPGRGARDRRGAPPASCAATAATATAATARRSTSASSRASAGWASAAARRATATPTPTRACACPSSRTSIIELGRDRHGRRRADAGPRPARARRGPALDVSDADQRNGSSTFQVLPSRTVRIAWRSPAAENTSTSASAPSRRSRRVPAGSHAGGSQPTVTRSSRAQHARAARSRCADASSPSMRARVRGPKRVVDGGAIAGARRRDQRLAPPPPGEPRRGRRSRRPPAAQHREQRGAPPSPLLMRAAPVQAQPRAHARHRLGGDLARRRAAPRARMASTRAGSARSSSPRARMRARSAFTPFEQHLLAVDAADAGGRAADVASFGLLLVRRRTCAACRCCTSRACPDRCA